MSTPRCLGRPAARRTTITALALLIAAGVSGCVQMPHDGPIKEADSRGQVDEQLGFYNDPNPPQPGEPPADIVKHFLDAMSANPIQISTAKQFLTKQEAASWAPFQGTITYGDSSIPEGSKRVAVTLDRANHLDGRGSWLGALPTAQRNLEFPMAREDGEWRISGAPDALIVPESWYEQNYRQVSLYFFDPSARILIPEPVFVPRGQQLVSSLVTALLAGPGRGMAHVERTYVPEGLQVSPSTRVRNDGIAEVDLDGQMPAIPAEQASLMVAQLAWTLSQDPDVTGLEITIGGKPITLAGGVSTFGLDQGLVYDPTVLQSSGLLYGLDGGRLVSGRAGAFSRVDGPMGAADLGLVSASVNLLATRVAGITADRARLLVTRVRGAGSPVQEVLSEGTGLLEPNWDFAGRLWVVNRPDRAEVSYVVRTRARPVRIRGISGTQVKKTLVSRDGSRFVAVVHSHGRDVVKVSRISYNSRGRVVGASRARVISGQLDPGVRIRDIGWINPSAVVVLGRPAPTISELKTVPIDGAPAEVGTISTTWPGRVRAIASSPSSAEPLYLWVKDGLVDLTTRGTNTVQIDDKFSSLDYVGG